ncbi:MAG: glycosyl hydrolase [Prolixibacteraceae bacterium]|jgi:mannan endo-1,4-beta-mannosidase|nr:glycosyl hydrolase [Prolixibacteraceae bacterium]
MTYRFTIFVIATFFAFIMPIQLDAQTALPIDDKASTETKALFVNLMKLSKNHTLFGHQHATEYGHGWSGDDNRSDVKSVCGSHPAVIGIDFMGFSGHSDDKIEKNTKRLRENVIDTYRRGGVTTVAWHFINPVSGGSFYWKDNQSEAAVKHIIPGGKAHNNYKEILSTIGNWAKSLESDNGELVPVIFRPYHEFDGGWFWWGAPHCTPHEFKTLWKFTVSYLRDTLDVHNFLYAFSPDNKFNNREDFLVRYPGDEWVDMIGMDNYADLGRDGYNLKRAARKLKIVSDYAREKGKLAAFTETGLESITNPEWWTQTLLKTMQMYDMDLCYVLVWRNDTNSPTHYYAPFPGHKSVPDFIRFYEHPYTLFEKDLVDIYKLTDD